MKITRTSEEYNNKQLLRVQALKGCDVCPCCGEKKTYLEYLNKGITNKGISSGGCETWYGRKNEQECSIFSLLIPHKNSHWKVDCFCCYTCGATWNSEPYEY